MTTDRLRDHSAVVVGVSSELGRACATRLAAEGATTMVVDRSTLALASVAKAIAEGGGTCVQVLASGDVERDAADVARQVSAHWRCLDVLVIAGGVVDWWAEDDDTFVRWEEALRENLLLPVFYTRALEPALKASSRASVVYYGTIDGLHGNPRRPAYSISRAGLVPLTHIVAHRLGPTGGRANCIAGAALTLNGPDVPSGLRAPGWDAESARQLTALQRFAGADEAAAVVAFLASADSSYVSGGVLTMDGGRTAITPGTALPNRSSGQ